MPDTNRFTPAQTVAEVDFSHAFEARRTIHVSHLGDEIWHVIDTTTNKPVFVGLKSQCEYWLGDR